MTTKRECLSQQHSNRERIEELCCLFVLGDLSIEERGPLEEHLRECDDCRRVVQEFERIALFDLPAVASLRTEEHVPASLEFANGDDLLVRVREKARADLERINDQRRLKEVSIARCPSLRWRKVRSALLATGWAVAAVLLIGILVTGRSQLKPASREYVPIPVPQNVSKVNEIENDYERAALRERDEAIKQLNNLEVTDRSKTLALVRATSQYKDLLEANASLKSQLTNREDELALRSAELDLSRKNLNEQIAAKDSLQAQLSDVNERFDRREAEVAHLQKIVATTPALVPQPKRELGADEAKEILGARELHIVDVYDVDTAGKPSKSYGRVYYMNRSLLVFYAFDLSRVEKNHRAVAFQAWGFRQPKTTTAESLGLFYLDNAALNRWTLRVSDPEVLSRIDTLFVTAEPPGGSRFPKGRRLLMASLAGPANHP